MTVLTLHEGDRVKIQRGDPCSRFEGKLATIKSVHPQSGCYTIALDDTPNKELVFFEYELIKYQICPGCSSDNIKSQKVSTTFKYGETVILPVEFTCYKCLNCSVEYTDDEAENAKEKAIAKHKAKTK